MRQKIAIRVANQITALAIVYQYYSTIIMISYKIVRILKLKYNHYYNNTACLEQMHALASLVIVYIP